MKSSYGNEKGCLPNPKKTKTRAAAADVRQLIIIPPSEQKIKIKNISKILVILMNIF